MSRPRPSALRLIGIAVAGVGILIVLAVVGFLLAFPTQPATPAAREALTHPPAGVRVEHHAGGYALVPEEPVAGLVFQPGARVEPEAYARPLTALAQQGVLVEVVDPPWGVALLAPDAPADRVTRHPGVEHWVVGGHSLGGVAASAHLGDRPQDYAGLLLWASYPGSSLAHLSLPTTTVGGANDGLTTPAELADRADLLPAGATITVLPGVNHAAFGDYGPQAGDGPLDQAHQAIAEASTPLFAEAVR